MLYLRILMMVLATAGAVVALASVAAPAAQAQGAEIEAAKAAGVVGERIDGYIGLVDDGAVDASLMRRINEINARRRAAYDELAQQAGATTAQVARLTGEKQVERVPVGHYYMDETGAWVRKSA